MKRIGLFGGTYNPIHKGHLALAKNICDAENLDELWFLVSPQNPFKVNMDLLDDTQRLRMVQLAIEDDKRLVASDFEFSLPKPSYTFHTLKALWEAYPSFQFELIIGADNWHMFPHWYKHEEIIARTPVIVYPRPGHELKQEDLPKGIRLVDAPLFPFSSTEVRQAIQQGKDPSDMLPDSVWDYIKEKHLYGYSD